MNRLRNEHGAMTLILMAMAISMVFSYFAYNLLANSQSQVTRAMQVEAQQNIADRIKNFLRSPMIVSYAVNVHNAPSVNTALRDCILVGEPQNGTTCTNVNIDFFQPTASGDQKFSGGVNSPAYFDRLAKPCDPVNSSSVNCAFKAITQCTFSCPGGQRSCAMTKVMNCDLEIAAVNNSTFKIFNFLKRTKLYVSTYTIRMNNDLSSWSVVRF